MGIRRNTLINFTGSLIAIGVSLITVPLYLDKIGELRYGVLAIVWLFLGYFGVLDMGLGRATTNQIAKLRKSTVLERENVFWSAFTANTILGVVGGILFWIVGRYFFSNVFTMPKELLPEILASVPWLAITVPIMTTSAVSRGAVAGMEYFGVLNVLQVSGTILFQVVTLIVAYWHGADLEWLIASGVLSRILIGAIYFEAARQLVPLQGKPTCNKTRIRALLSFGGWITVTNLISPILVALDRFVIGTLKGAQALTYYTIPFNLVSRFSILPGSLSQALFPRFSAYSSAEAKDIAIRSVIGLAAVTTPLVVVGIVIIKPFLSVWINPEFAEASAPVGEAVLFGVWINSLAFVPFGMLQAQGKPQLVALFHLVELVPFCLVLWIALKLGGIYGAAWAWILRVSGDAVLLFLAARFPKKLFGILLPGALLIGLTEIVVCFLGDSYFMRLLVGAGLVSFTLIWAWLVSPDLLRGYALSLLSSFSVCRFRR